MRLARAERLPFPDDRFDWVLSQLVIDKVDGPTALREMRRVARLGAVIAGCVWDFEEGVTLLRAYWDAALATDPDRASAARGAERPPHSRPAELHDLISRAGLDAVEVGERVVGGAPESPIRREF